MPSYLSCFRLSICWRFAPLVAITNTGIAFDDGWLKVCCLLQRSEFKSLLKMRIYWKSTSNLQEFSSPVQKGRWTLWAESVEMFLFQYLKFDLIKTTNGQSVTVWAIKFLMLLYHLLQQCQLGNVFSSCRYFIVGNYSSLCLDEGADFPTNGRIRLYWALIYRFSEYSCMVYHTLKPTTDCPVQLALQLIVWPHAIHRVIIKHEEHLRLGRMFAVFLKSFAVLT